MRPAGAAVRGIAASGFAAIAAAACGSTRSSAWRTTTSHGASAGALAIRPRQMREASSIVAILLGGEADIELRLVVLCIELDGAVEREPSPRR